MLRVSEDELEFRGDKRFLFGAPFSGVGFALYPNGQLSMETPYVDGWAEGLCREWHENGQLASERVVSRGRSNGHYLEWRQTGEIKVRAKYELGIELEYNEWSETGELITSRKMDPTAPNSQYPILVKFRQIYGAEANS